MKKNLIFWLVGILSFSSCSKDFLDVAPETAITSSTFYKTESHFNLALVAAYEPLRSLVHPGIYMDEMRSDNTFFRYYAPDRGPANWVEDIIQWTDQSQTTAVNNRYYADYRGISRANIILSRLETAEISEEVKNQVAGETLFLRAFYYFDLVTHYGGVPLYLEEVVDEQSSYVSNSTIEEVYAQVIKDLNGAIPNLPVAATFPQTGRATKGAAKMLLAKAYMSKPQREYVLAESELGDIMNMNYELLEDYGDVFDPNNKNHQESIFEVQFREGPDGQQSDFIYYMLPKTEDTWPITGLRANNVSLGGWNVPNQELIDSYEAGDLRLNESIQIAEGTLAGGNPGFDPIIILEIRDPRGYVPEPGKFYFPYVSKYVHGPYALPNNTGENWPVFRFADALLLMAENLVQQGKNDLALPYLNKVRTRAGLDDLDVATLENVLNERRHELAFENHRWTDLIRTGKAIEVMSAYGQRMKQEYPFLPANSFNVTENRLIYPIPYRDLQLNKNLKQNPGY
ncbi:MAG: RagB/SusD family nutrient uptake outer membrane protein [Chitinophagaceae bacterium]|nr:RagB/SusD family nutrient uptake outer membrane protein [Chitinophagaceae bacterium]